MSDLLRNAKRFFKRNSSTILTCIGVVGVISTAILSVKATPKAIGLIEEEKNIKGGDISKLEAVKVAWAVYIPAVTTGLATIACIFGSEFINKKKQASLISTYILLENSFKDYKRKLKELYGNETHKSIVDALVVEKSENPGINGGYFAVDCDLSIEDNNGEPKLFYEEYSNRYFEATLEQVISAEYHLNRNYILRGYTVLNEFYDFLGIKNTDQGSILGWTPTDEGEYWIEFNHRKVTMDDGLECYIIEMPFAPQADFHDYW